MKLVKKYGSVVIFLVAVLVIWQLMSNNANDPLKFPSLQKLGEAFIQSILEKGLLEAAFATLKLIIQGLAYGIVLSFILSTLAILFNPVKQIANTLISVFDLLPGIAILPLLMFWITDLNLVVIILMIHGILWPMSKSILEGYASVPKIYTEVGENIGLKGFGIVRGVMLPASFPYILSGLRTGWARAWRAIISAEMVFGGTVTSGVPGIGFFLFTQRYQMNIGGIISGLIAIIVVGLIVEYGIFAQIEKRTVKKWGMVR